ncbi:helix-hairpin-helix domain-containing protein [Alteribacillus sp. JSM 102045]|uniref:helix-hairpin-helix domain-containing protein n=1 Tax=Alteribacillus sp. JSM 102045 TaxID=1562101 RepID=UPI0035BEE53E
MNWKNPVIISTGIGVISLFLFIVFTYVPSQETIEKNSANSEDFFQEFAEETDEEGSEKDEQNTTIEEMIVLVDVKGQVQHPGVYELKKDSRVIDAIDSAGGLKEEGDATSVNFAERVHDEMIIYVPKQGEESIEHPSPEITEKDNKVRINYADVNELETLPGIGPAKAEAIISYREEFGGFKELEDLTNVSGIGEKSVEQLKEIATAD